MSALRIRKHTKRGTFWITLNTEIGELFEKAAYGIENTFGEYYKTKKIMSWEKIFIKISDGVKNLPSPYHKEGKLEYLYVIIDKEERLGYLLIWCSKTNKGVQFSRLKVPDDPNINSIASEELSLVNVPNISLQDVSVFYKRNERYNG